MIAHAKAIHIAKSLKKPTAQPKLVNKYVFATAERTIEIKSQLPTTNIVHLAYSAKYEYLSNK